MREKPQRRCLHDFIGKSYNDISSYLEDIET